MDSNNTVSHPSDPQDRRAALLAAAEARAQPRPTTSSTPTTRNHAPNQPTSSGSWVPNETHDKTARLEFGRIVSREIMGKNNYQTAAQCIQTLIKVASNVVQHPQDPKYAKLKSSNTLIKHDIINVKGGLDYLVALGFRSKTVEFVAYYLIDPFPPRPQVLHDLEMGIDVLEAHLPQALDRVTHSQAASTLRQAHDSDAARRTQALAEIEADREKVRERSEREKQAREMHERRMAEQQDQAAADQSHDSGTVT